MHVFHRLCTAYVIGEQFIDFHEHHPSCVLSVLNWLSPSAGQVKDPTHVLICGTCWLPSSRQSTSVTRISLCELLFPYLLACIEWCLVPCSVLSFQVSLGTIRWDSSIRWCLGLPLQQSCVERSNSWANWALQFKRSGAGNSLRKLAKHLISSAWNLAA